MAVITATGSSLLAAEQCDQPPCCPHPCLLLLPAVKLWPRSRRKCSSRIHSTNNSSQPASRSQRQHQAEDTSHYVLSSCHASVAMRKSCGCTTLPPLPSSVAVVPCHAKPDARRGLKILLLGGVTVARMDVAAREHTSFSWAVAPMCMGFRSLSRISTMQHTWGAHASACRANQVLNPIHAACPALLGVIAHGSYS